MSSRIRCQVIHSSSLGRGTCLRERGQRDRHLVGCQVIHSSSLGRVSVSLPRQQRRTFRSSQHISCVDQPQSINSCFRERRSGEDEASNMDQKPNQAQQLILYSKNCRRGTDEAINMGLPPDYLQQLICFNILFRYRFRWRQQGQTDQHDPVSGYSRPLIYLTVMAQEWITRIRNS